MRSVHPLVCLGLFRLGTAWSPVLVPEPGWLCPVLACRQFLCLQTPQGVSLTHSSTVLLL